MAMCLVARIMPCCVVSAVSLHMEPELPRVGPLKSQIFKPSMEIEGNFGQLTRTEHCRRRGGIDPLPPWASH